MTDRILLDEVDSTMAEAARRAGDLAGPTWILAKRQSAGKGRRGRPWSMGEGNFAATLVMPADVRDAALRSFTASLALYDTFEALGVRGLSLKWPNDVLLKGGKVAGILLEMHAHRLAIGIGINLAHAPGAADVEPDALTPVTLGVDTDPEEVLDLLLPQFDAWEARYQVQGFEPLRTAWLARAARLGEVIRARTVTEEHHGTFESIDNEGRLVLSTARGPVSIAAADVFF
ncbi:MAG: biotin--[acetyl-CoA-carboxylase] ligase [Pseudomonadota bacterium]